MFDGLRENWEEMPPRRGWPSILVGLILFTLVMLFMFGARAQQQPQGLDVKNQITTVISITVGTTKFTPTKGFFIDAASACSVTFLSAGQGAVSQTIGNFATGIWHPMSIVQVSASACPGGSLYAGY